MSKGKGRSIRETIQATIQLMERGSSGEREAAKNRLLFLSRKHGIDLAPYGYRISTQSEEIAKEERALAEAQASAVEEDEVEALFDQINRAAPYIDAGTKPKSWPASMKLKVLYCAASTCGRPGAARDAISAIQTMLERARGYWKLNLIPDPFWNEENGLPPTAAMEAAE